MGRISVTAGTRYLIDTHVLLWDLSDDPRLSQAHAAILTGEEPKFLSVASIWEIAIKVSAGKLQLPADFLDVVVESEVGLLTILPEHAWEVGKLPPHHNDPFDRLLICQARREGLTILTSDRRFSAYDVALG
jgi:PIN domain nuclease of toxin-antitoxin system